MISMGRTVLPAVAGAGAGGAATMLANSELGASDKLATGAVWGSGLAAGLAHRPTGVGIVAGALAGYAAMQLTEEPALAAYRDAGTGAGAPSRPDGPTAQASGRRRITTVSTVEARLNDQLAVPAPLHSYTPRPGDMLPDGEQMAPEDLYIRREDGRRVLRFNSVVGNNGPGAMQLAEPTRGPHKGQLFQSVFGAGDKPRLVPMEGEFVHDQREEHDHLHFDDFEKYELFRVRADGSTGRKVGENRKASFYITNIERIGRTPADGQVNFSALGDTYKQQGIGVGWADVYGAGLAGQEIDVSKLTPGRYVLRQTFDPSNRIAEINEKNNVRETVIELS